MSGSKDKPAGAVDKSLKNKLEKNMTRRGFIKNTVVAGLAVAGGALVAKKAARAVLKEDTRKLYIADELGVERTWKGRKFALMSREEKREMVSALIDSAEPGKK
ncbi:MAG: hypothetical protein ACE5DR_00930 [Thermodesulfobacteriota bacterium]